MARSRRVRRPHMDGNVPMLDGNPEAVIGHETGAARSVWARFDRDRLHQMILDSIDAQGDQR